MTRKTLTSHTTFASSSCMTSLASHTHLLSTHYRLPNDTRFILDNRSRATGPQGKSEYATHPSVTHSPSRHSLNTGDLYIQHLHYPALLATGIQSSCLLWYREHGVMVDLGSSSLMAWDTRI
ncbi:hypothetical protein N657DRAFT_396197 [Parathielavia appendiculata]|uniref:Uncharacterized protein n=1 Tax=Parathielavia appendiculata TaxID=2587402 RepID=A0AAN6U3Q4_9PEZI|nr:hypothetical protein N657DRAFT_396197 [Parathielavia appendiculata]